MENKIEFLDTSNRVPSLPDGSRNKKEKGQNTKQSNSDKDWIYIEPISISRIFIGSLYFRDTSEGIKNLKLRLAKLCNILGISKTALLPLLVNKGAEKIEHEINLGKDGNIPKKGTDEYQSWQVARLQQELLKKESLNDSLAGVYEKLGEEEFISRCKKLGIEYDDFLISQLGRTKKLKQCDRDRDWLKNFKNPGQSARTNEVRSAAEAEGIINKNDDKGWNRLYTTGRRMGLPSGVQGVWKWTE